MASEGAVEGSRFSEVEVATGVGAILNSTRWALTYVGGERRVQVVVLKEAVGEMTVWIREPRRLAGVTWVEAAVRAIARGHDAVEMAEVEAEAGMGTGEAVVRVVAQGQRLEVVEGEAKGVSSWAGAVGEAAREVAAGVEGTGGAGAVGVRQMEVGLEVVGVEEVPMSVEVVKVASLPGTCARSKQRQS